MLGMAVAFLVTACAPSLPSPTLDPLHPTIAALKTEQAFLLSLLAKKDYRTPTPRPTSTAKPTPTPSPNAVPISNQPSLLPRPVYFLRPDSFGLDQVFRLEVDGATLSQLTTMASPILDFDVSSDGDLAFIFRPNEEQIQLRILPAGESESRIVEKLTGVGVSLNHVFWMPNGDMLTYHRSVLSQPAEPGEETGPFFNQELVLYNQFTRAIRLLMRTGHEPLNRTVESLSTTESLEYSLDLEWTADWQVVAVSQDSRYLLVTDNARPFWLVYDLRLDFVRELEILGSSADFSANGQKVCLSGFNPISNYQPPQALLCADFTTDIVSVHLTTPPWQPFGLNYWSNENAVVFLQQAANQEGPAELQLYGMNLFTDDPLLLRSEMFSFTTPLAPQDDILHTPQENQASAQILLAGQSPKMDSPGLVLLPLDPTKPPVYLPALGSLRLLRWGPPIIP